MTPLDHLGEALDALQPHVPVSQYERWRADLDAVREQVGALRGLVVQHHAFGAMDGVMAGDDCPVCRGSSVDTNPVEQEGWPDA